MKDQRENYMNLLYTAGFIPWGFDVGDLIWYRDFSSSEQPKVKIKEAEITWLTTCKMRETSTFEKEKIKKNTWSYL